MQLMSTKGLNHLSNDLFTFSATYSEVRTSYGQ